MLEVTKDTARPLVKWAGGKGRLLPQLRKYYPRDFNNYFEPFFGGGAVFFDVRPGGKVYLNDVDDTLMNVYTHVQDDLEEVIAELKKLERQYKRIPQDERDVFYYHQRDTFNSSDEGILKTALLVFLNRTCFNGLYRENSKGKFNVPFGRYENPTICDEENLKAVSERLRHAHLLRGSYRAAVAEAGKGDFIYLDPPYAPLNTTSSFTAYHEDGFTGKDQEDLRDLFVELDKRGCYVLHSNSTAPLILDLYKNYRQESVRAGRSINATGTKRGKISELVVLNY
jgi:DNA adenine methylase